jgi:hypothetical protein
MSNAGHEPTHRPLPDCTFDPLGYILGVQFQAPVKLVRQGGMEFGKKLSEHIEPHGVELQDNAWTFSQPLGDRPGGLLKVAIQEQMIALEASQPTYALDWFETRYEFILDEFRKTFKPAYVIATMAKVVGTVEVDGDARRFLFEHVAHIPELRLEALGRPVHIVGIRLGMPAFQAAEPPKGKRKKPKIIETKWLVETRAESLGADIRKLYLEAAGQWPLEPKEWNAAATKEVVARLGTVKSYLIERLLPFLTKDVNSGGK